MEFWNLHPLAFGRIIAITWIVTGILWGKFYTKDIDQYPRASKLASFLFAMTMFGMLSTGFFAILLLVFPDILLAFRYLVIGH